MANLLVGIIIVLAVGMAIAYIVKEKKKGVQCIGCPMAPTCPSANGGSCSGGCQANTKDFINK